MRAFFYSPAIRRLGPVPWTRQRLGIPCDNQEGREMRRDVEDFAGKTLPDIELGELRRVGSAGDTNAHVSCRLLYRACK